MSRASRVGEEVIGPRLRQMLEAHPSVGEVRGTGVFWAVELVKDRQTREPLAPYGGTSEAMNAVVAECKANGLLLFVNFNRIHVVPPCTISPDEATEGLSVLDAALTLADQAVSV